jgi:ribosome maturation factor RimP
VPRRYRKLRGDTAYYPFAARTGLRARQRRHARALRTAGAAALILAAVLALRQGVFRGGQPDAPAPLLDQFVTVEDCEKVTRQLQFALEVDGVEYKRLEVSSPGIDRPLRHEQDFVRFEGSVIDITLKAPMGAAAAGQVSANRKKFRGTLERAESGGWQIVWRDEPAVKPGQKVSKKRVPAPLQAMGFTLDELRDARLAPIVDFKGRAGKAGQGAA